MAGRGWFEKERLGRVLYQEGCSDEAVTEPVDEEEEEVALNNRVGMW